MLNSTSLRGRLLEINQLIISLCRRLKPVKALSLLALGASLLLLGTAAARTVASRKANKASSIYTVTATAYEAVAGQTDSKPFLTADNSRIPRGYGSHTRWLALSRDLLKPWGGPFEFGDKVRVEGISPALDGVYTVHDTMNRRYRHRLDVLAHPREHLSLSRPGVRLRRLGPTRSSTRAARKRPRPTTEPGRMAAAQLHKTQPRTAATRPAKKQTAAKRRPPATALAKNTKPATHNAKRRPQAHRPAPHLRHKQLAASPRRPQQRRAASRPVAHR